MNLEHKKILNQIALGGIRVVKSNFLPVEMTIESSEYPGFRKGTGEFIHMVRFGDTILVSDEAYQHLKSIPDGKI